MGFSIQNEFRSHLPSLPLHGEKVHWSRDLTGAWGRKSASDCMPGGGAAPPGHSAARRTGRRRASRVVVANSVIPELRALQLLRAALRLHVCQHQQGRL